MRDKTIKWDSDMSDFENKQWDLLEQLFENTGRAYVFCSEEDKEILQKLFFTKVEEA
jgi:hypothetical protein